MKQEERLLTLEVSNEILDRTDHSKDPYNSGVHEMLVKQDTQSYSLAQKDIGKWLSKSPMVDSDESSIRTIYLQKSDIKALLNGTWEVV